MTSRLCAYLMVAFIASSYGHANAADNLSQQLDSTEQPTAFDCLIEPSAKVELASETSGILDKVLVKRGERVTVGQHIAALRLGIEAANLAIAEQKATDDSTVRVKRAKEVFEARKLKRHQGLISSRIVAPQQADEIKTDRLVAELERKSEESSLERYKMELKRARAAYEARRIRSTINGVILSLDKEPGEYVSGESIATLVTLDPLNVEVFTPISVAIHLEPGDEAEVISQHHEKMKASIVVVDKVADAASRTVRVLLALPNPDLKIVAGQNCKAQFSK